MLLSGIYSSANPHQIIIMSMTAAPRSSKTIAGYDAEQLQADVRAAEEAMKQSEMEQIQSLDDLLESFAPTDGRR